MKTTTKVILCLSVLLSLLVSLCACGSKDEEETEIPPEFAPKTSVYGVTELKYQNPLSSQFYAPEELKDDTKFRYEVGYTLFSATCGGQTENFVGPTYVILPKTTAFYSVDTTDENGTADMKVYINIHANDDGMTQASAPEITAYTSIAAYAVHDKDDNDTGYVVYVLDNEMWIGRFQAADAFSPSDYIVKTDIQNS